MGARVSIVFVCDRAEIRLGCGTCRVDAAETGPEHHSLGVLDRSVWRFFKPEIEQGLIEVTWVDPLNQLYLVPKLWHDAWHYRPGWKRGLQISLQLFAIPAVIVNGRVLSHRGVAPSPDELCHQIWQTLGQEPHEASYAQTPQ